MVRIKLKSITEFIHYETIQ